MKAFRTFATIAAGLLLASCASHKSLIETTYDKDGKAVKTTETLTDYASYAKAQQKPSEKPKLFDMECEPVCTFKKLVVYDPQSGGGGAVQVAAPPEQIETLIVKEIGATVRQAIPYGAAAVVLTKALGVANSSRTTIDDHSDRSSTSSSSSTSNTSTSTTTSTSVTASGSGSAAVAGGGSATGSAPTTTNTNTNSNNRTATGGNTTTGSGGSGTTGGP